MRSEWIDASEARVLSESYSPYEEQLNEIMRRIKECAKNGMVGMTVYFQYDGNIAGWLVNPEICDELEKRGFAVDWSSKDDPVCACVEVTW